MCEFHLKGQCFHPEKTKKGLVATACSVHDCSKCTNTDWQQQRVDEQYEYYQSILAITSNAIKVQPDKKTKVSSILSTSN